MDPNSEHAALQQYLRENMLFQQRKLQEFLANGGGNGPQNEPTELDQLSYL
jgi:hypothetical protein